MPARRLAGYIAVGLVIGLVTGWLGSVAVSSLAQTAETTTTGGVKDLTFANVSHTSSTVGVGTGIDFGCAGTDMSIWAGTADNRRALVTVTRKPSSGPFNVCWTDSNGRQNNALLEQNRSITVFARKVWIAGTPSLVEGTYWITVNIAE